MVSPRNRLGMLHVSPVLHIPTKNLCSTAPTILSAVRQTLSAHGATSVTVVGHSLGAALALLDAVYFRIQLSASVHVRMVGYGMPRVGNQAFANWVDSNLSGQVTHINNEEDPIPIVPGRFLDFVHPSGEVHITDSGTWESCPGEFFSRLSFPGVRMRVFGGALTHVRRVTFFRPR